LEMCKYLAPVSRIAVVNFPSPLFNRDSFPWKGRANLSAVLAIYCQLLCGVWQVFTGLPR
jgi:hypothetical protein